MSKSIFNFHIFQKYKKLNLKLPKIELNCLKLLKIKNWIENCPKSIFIFWNYWKLNKNEMDVFVHGWLKSKFEVRFSFFIFNLKNEKLNLLQSVIRAPKVPFNFHFKIGMENDIFVYLKFDSKLKIEKRQLSIFNFYWKTEK